MLRAQSTVVISQKNAHSSDKVSRPKSAEDANERHHVAKGVFDILKYTSSSSELLRTLLGNEVEEKENSSSNESTNDRIGRAKSANSTKGGNHVSGGKEESNAVVLGKESDLMMIKKYHEPEKYEEIERDAKPSPNTSTDKILPAEATELLTTCDCLKSIRPFNVATSEEHVVPVKQQFKANAANFEPVKTEMFFEIENKILEETNQDDEGLTNVPTTCTKTDKPTTNNSKTDVKNLEATHKSRAPTMDKESYRPVTAVDEESTYDEIISLLETIDSTYDNDITILERNFQNSNRIEWAPMVRDFTTEEEEVSDLKDVHNLLDSMEKETEAFIKTTATGEGALKTNGQSTFLTPRLEELIDEDPVVLAHEILALKIQIEDQKRGIQLLRETLQEMKEKNASVNAEHQEALNKVNAEAETVIQRHQKFIKQLLKEKKQLNETITKLVQDLKLQEEKFKKKVTTLEDRHSLDIKRAKEAQALAEKIKRDKWMEVKTRKIKEMTVKSLEPELSRMALRQQQEITELKNLQIAELEAVELRATRRASQLMDDLRAELLREKATAIERETQNLRINLEREFEEERHRFEASQQRLKEEIRKWEERAAAQEAEFRQKIIQVKREADEERDRLNREYKEKMEQARHHHEAELKKIRGALEKEKENWAISFRAEEENKFREMEGELVKRFKRERDQEIETAIETLEKEAARLQLEMNEASENKLKRLREKLERDIKEAEVNEAALREKLGETKCQLMAKEELIAELNCQIRRHQAEMDSLNQRCREMTLERTDLKEIIRKEFEKCISDVTNEKEVLVKQICILKENHRKELEAKDEVHAREKAKMQKELAKVYDRIKTVVTKKEIVIESLRKENDAKTQRCLQLESLLEKQRKNLLLR